MRLHGVPLQNIPIRTSGDSTQRERTPSIFDLDYSAIERRILAHILKNAEECGETVQGDDLHQRLQYLFGRCEKRKGV